MTEQATLFNSLEKYYLKKYYLTLKSIAVKNKKLDTFEKKWNTYKDLLENT